MKKILIVEDEMSFARMIKLRLESAGYEVSVASDAYSGTQMAIKGDPDLIVLDLGMPAGGGFAVLERVRNFPDKALIPVIILTGKVIDDKIKKQADALGASAILSKPYDPKQFMDMVQQLAPNQP